MHRILLTAALFMVASVSAPAESAVSQSPAQTAAIIQQLRSAIVPLQSVDPNANSSELLPFKQMVGNARLVGLGEGTHGTSEFFSMKDRLFRYMVQNMGFTVFAMEANWTDSLKIDDYITTGRGNIHEALHSTFAIWDNQEVFDLIEWMRAYNMSPGTHATLHFVGVDMQSPMAATDMVTHFYERAKPADIGRVTAGYACVHFAYTQLSQAFSSLTEAQKAACIANAESIQKSVFRDTEHAPAPEQLSIRHAALVAVQSARQWSGMPTTGMNARDSAMAENAQWVMHDLYPHARVALWAHNGHVAANISAFTSMGTLLRQALGKDYFALGFSFDRGEISLNGRLKVRLGPGADDTAAAILRQGGSPMFLLDTHAPAPSSPLAQWLARDIPFSMLGALQNVTQAQAARDYPMIIGKAFDAIIFVEESHAAHSFAFASAQPVQIVAGAGGRSFTSDWKENGSAAIYDVGSDCTTIHSTGPSVWISSSAAAKGDLGTIMRTIDIAELRGKRVQISGFLKSENIVGTARFWMRVDGTTPGSPIAFDNMENRSLSGTMDWKPFSIVLDVAKDASAAFTGLLITGSGKAWADDVAITIVENSTPVTATPSH